MREVSCSLVEVPTTVAEVMAVTHEEQQERVEAMWEKWRDRLGLASWLVNRDYHDGEYVQGDGRSSSDAIASADVDWAYQRATLSFNLQKVEHQDDAALENVIVHEAMHILINELREDGMKHEEHACTMLAWALIRTAQDVSV